MAIHWLELEQRVLDKVNRPSVGTADQMRMVRWANKVTKDIAISTLVNKARLIVGFIAGNVVLLEEDWRGTEEVGAVAYGFGLDGAFYIKYGLLIDNIKECEREAVDESEGGYIYDSLDYEIKYKERQEEFWRKPYADARPVYYGVYRYWVKSPACRLTRHALSLGHMRQWVCGLIICSPTMPQQRTGCSGCNIDGGDLLLT